MIFFKLQFIEILLHIKPLSFLEQRNGLTKYKNCPCAYWNVLLWDNILKDNAIFSNNINNYMFNNFCKNHCTKEQSNLIFTRISQHENHINYEIFDNFLKLLKDFEYINIINTLLTDSTYNIISCKNISFNNNFLIKKSKSCPAIIKYSNKYINVKKTNNFNFLKFIVNIFSHIFTKLNIDKCYC